MLIPVRRETIISSYSLSQIRQLLEIAVHKDFNGRVSGKTFRLSRKVNYPNNYIPLVHGTLESSSRGCIIMVKYTLFFSTRMFLIFWSSLCLLIGLVLLAFTPEYSYGLIALGGAMANYGVTMANFNKQFKLTRNLLLTSLEIHEEP